MLCSAKQMPGLMCELVSGIAAKQVDGAPDRDECAEVVEGQAVLQEGPKVRHRLPSYHPAQAQLQFLGGHVRQSMHYCAELLGFSSLDAVCSWQRATPSWH